MKTKMFFVAAAVAVISLSSCKKEFECECYYGSTGTYETETHKGKDAQDACQDASKPLQAKACSPSE
jgi:hypothetical protein